MSFAQFHERFSKIVERKLIP